MLILHYNFLLCKNTNTTYIKGDKMATIWEKVISELARFKFTSTATKDGDLTWEKFDNILEETLPNNDSYKGKPLLILNSEEVVAYITLLDSFNNVENRTLINLHKVVHGADNIVIALQNDVFEDFFESIEGYIDYLKILYDSLRTIRATLRLEVKQKKTQKFIWVLDSSVKEHLEKDKLEDILDNLNLDLTLTLEYLAMAVQRELNRYNLSFKPLYIWQ